MIAHTGMRRYAIVRPIRQQVAMAGSSMAPTPDRFPLSSGICASNLGLRMGFSNKCEGYGREGWAFLALGGTILTLVSAIFALASPKTRIAWALLLTGGILAVAGGRYGRSLILRLEAHWVSQRAIEPGGFT